MVVEMLKSLKTAKVQVEAPNWDDRAWTVYLRGMYKDAGLQSTLEYVTKAGEQGSYESSVLPEKSDKNTDLHRLLVAFPNGSIPITYKESIDGRLLSVEILSK